jgi:type IX secretion system PorP/SprF family membrane protein
VPEIRSVLLSLTFLITALNASGQLPVIYKQYYQIPALYNPASADNINKFNTFLGYESFPELKGSRNNIYFSFLTNSSVFGRKKPRSAYGILCTSEKAGSYINRNRAYLMYCYNLKVESRFLVSAGINAGFYNYYIADNPAGVTRSELTPDGSAGINIQYLERFSFGASFNHITGNKENREKSNLQLYRHYIYTADYLADLTPEWKMETGILYRYIPREYSNLHCYNKWEYREIFGAGLLYGARQAGGMVSISDKNNDLLNWLFAFSFYVPAGRNALQKFNTFDVSLKIFVK